MWEAYKTWLDQKVEASMEQGRHKMAYLSAPYTRVEDKAVFMDALMKWAGKAMLADRYHHVVSPLFIHYAPPLVPELGQDYAFWGDYSRTLLARCDRMVVIQWPGWDTSVGVGDEIAYATQQGIPVCFVTYEDFLTIINN